jgi:Ca2+:H+ antiporter
LGWPALYHEQTYNLQGASSFLAVIRPLAVLGLVLPNFTSAPGGTLSALHEGFLMLMSVGLYGIFTCHPYRLRHRHYFLQGDEIEEQAPHGREMRDLRPAAYHGTPALLYIVPIVSAVEEDCGADRPFDRRAGCARGAARRFLVAAADPAPESMAAVRAALANQLQRAINLLLGSVLASISLTIPAVLAIGLLTDRHGRAGAGICGHHPAAG